VPSDSPASSSLNLRRFPPLPGTEARCPFCAVTDVYRHLPTLVYCAALTGTPPPPSGQTPMEFSPAWLLMAGPPLPQLIYVLSQSPAPPCSFSFSPTDQLHDSPEQKLSEMRPIDSFVIPLDDFPSTLPPFPLIILIGGTSDRHPASLACAGPDSTPPLRYVPSSSFCCIAKILLIRRQRKNSSAPGSHAPLFRLTSPGPFQ